MKGLEYSISHLCEAESLGILQRFDTMFTPCLSTRVDIKSYSIKLSKYASWILCKHCSSVVGYIAYYHNIESSTNYITSICVLDTFRNYKIATHMLEYIIKEDSSSISTIKLECRKNNMSALQFYKKNGFAIAEDTGDNYIMVKLLK